MASVNESVILVNMTTREVEEVEGTRGVLSLSVDWLTQRVFWANPHKHMVRFIMIFK